MQVQPAFTDIELSFLQLTKKRHISNDDVNALKLLWAKYFLDKATAAADKAWEEKGYTQDTMDKLTKGEN
jgi:hypothetical protein